MHKLLQHISISQRHRGLKKAGGAKSCNLPTYTQISDGIMTDSSKFPQQESMGAQNFNSASKFRSSRAF